MKPADIDKLTRIFEWLSEVGDGAPDASKTQRMALGYADDIQQVLAEELCFLDSSDEQLFKAFDEFAKTRGAHEGEQGLNISGYAGKWKVAKELADKNERTDDAHLLPYWERVRLLFLELGGEKLV
jgi:hypothetical protein